MQNSPALQLNPKHGLSANVVVVGSSGALVSIDVVSTSGGAVSDAEKEVVLLTDDAVVLDIDVAGLSDQSTTVTERPVVSLIGDSVSTDVG
jgi:shikimate kinase